MEDKIRRAKQYVAAHAHDHDPRNDAANIFADNYEEYCCIWEALEEVA